MEPFWCSKCLAMSTRPRITFDEHNVCNACRWFSEKPSVNWDGRSKELHKLLDSHRKLGKSFDCVVPVSGGKDGSYVAYRLKHELGMNPLCVTVRPALPTSLGEENLEAFVQSGYDLIRVAVADEMLGLLNRAGFRNLGFPYYGWLVAIHTVPISIASHMGIGLVIYGEDGEVEYGGDDSTKSSPFFGTEYIDRIYLSSQREELARSVFDGSVPDFFNFHSGASSVDVIHWSYFEEWDPYRNYLIAKEHCGLRESSETNVGTFTNFAQNDQALYALHTYLMYLKFGFGRATQDASIEVRRGAMDRNQAMNLVRLYDGQAPTDEMVDQYLEHFRISKSEYLETLRRWANPLLFDEIEGTWVRKFEVH